MTASSLDLSDRRELRLLADLVVAIRLAKPDARFMLVGAMARDLLLSFAHGIQSRRATEDLDFAFAVANWHGNDPSATCRRYAWGVPCGFERGRELRRCIAAALARSLRVC